MYYQDINVSSAKVPSDSKFARSSCSYCLQETQRYIDGVSSSAELIVISLYQLVK